MYRFALCLAMIAFLALPRLTVEAVLYSTGGAMTTAVWAFVPSLLVAMLGCLVVFDKLREAKAKTA